MRVSAYYVVRPRAELLERLARACPEVLPIFQAPSLWSRSEAGRAEETPREWTERLQLTFLLGLQEHLADDAESPALRGCLLELLGPEPWSAATFDRWWSIERFTGIDADADEVARAATPEQVARLRGADGWRAALVERARKGDEDDRPSRR